MTVTEVLHAALRAGTLEFNRPAALTPAVTAANAATGAFLRCILPASPWMRAQRDLVRSRRKTSLEFVTFHVGVGDGSEVHPNQTLRHREYMSMIDMMFASARLMDMSARTIVLSDAGTDFDQCRTRINAIMRADVDGSKLMLERTLRQLRHVEASAFDMPMVILDTDILINAPLQPAITEDFDVAVTWRENKAQPINGGFLVLNNSRPEASRRFMRRLAATFAERYADSAAWFGDQLALRDCVGLSLKEMRAKSLVEVDGCRIQLLPCDTYNFSPENRYSEILTDRADKVVMHFKGERKRLMGPYWRAWLRPRQSFSPLVHLRARGERKSLASMAAAEAALPIQGGDSEAESLVKTATASASQDQGGFA